MIASADLAICHMETPIGEPGAAVGLVGRSTPGGYSLIAAPYELAGDLRRAGFDRCSTASNHSWDLGADGVASTLAALDAAGITHTGTARSKQEAAVTTLDVAGVRVAHLSYARNSNTGFPSETWRVNRAVDAATVIADVTNARRLGAEVVIVSLHVFVEIRSTPTDADRDLVTEITGTSRAVGAPVDLVVIHGPHTIQPFEIVHGTAVFWSLGNLVSGMGVAGRGRYSDLTTLDGLAGAARFTEQPDGSFVAAAAPVLLCEMTGSRVVYPAIEALVAGIVPPADIDDIEACMARSAPVLGGF
jgi:poly-gamma-glutamate synthesis protein (capsule biosynthesis protein)